ncbi:MAG: hypothetical protein KKG99_06295 [Bacteroidetes bacterium]|nr:hypothetical protein [Bacteroidota bacterium]
MRIITWPKWYIYFSILIAVVFFIYHFRSPSNIRNEKFKRDVRIEFNGHVIGKYIDINNHNYKICLIQSNTDTIRFLLNFDISGLFNYANVGDSIIKNKDESKIVIIRNNVIKEFFLKYE